MMPEETDAVSQDDGQAASAFVEQGLHSADSETETNRKSPRSARAIFGRFEPSNISRIISCRPLSGNNYRFTGLWSRFDPTDDLLRLPVLNGRKNLFRGTARLDLQEEVPVPGDPREDPQNPDLDVGTPPRRRPGSC